MMNRGDSSYKGLNVGDATLTQCVEWLAHLRELERANNRDSVHISNCNTEVGNTKAAVMKRFDALVAEVKR